MNSRHGIELGLALFLFLCGCSPAALEVVAPSQMGGTPDTTSDSSLRYWAQWRGPLGTGEAPLAKPPVRWSESENLRWKAPLPGRGHASPIVWGELVFLTTALPVGERLELPSHDPPGAHDNAPVTHRQQFLVLAIDRSDGEVRWQRLVHEAIPHHGAHASASLASASPVADGERVFAYFGSHGLYALNHQGDVLWSKDLGLMESKHGHGEGASPALYEDTLIVNWDHQGPSFLVAFDAASGEERWRVERDEPTSWSTPIIVEHGGRAQVVVSGTERLRSHDLATGELLWECGGLSHNIVASPVAADGMVFAGSSYERQALLAIRLEGAAGDLTLSDNLAWMRRRRTPYVPSPLLSNGWLYVLHHYQGTLSRIDASNGEEPAGPFRLQGIDHVYASPVAADGRIYVTSLDGNTTVLSGTAEPEVLAYNILDDTISASLALVEGEVFARGERFLYCLAAP